MLHIYSIRAIIWWSFELFILLRSRVTAPTDRVKEWRTDDKARPNSSFSWENALKNSPNCRLKKSSLNSKINKLWIVRTFSKWLVLFETFRSINFIHHIMWSVKKPNIVFRRFLGNYKLVFIETFTRRWRI
jgi:hypothetical protein